SNASRARGHAVANPAARSGIATKSPTTGIGLEIGSHPASATAAARPIQRPITTANVTLAAREASIKMIRVLTTTTIKAVVMIKPMKSSMSFARSLDWPCRRPDDLDLSSPSVKDVQDHLLAL